MSLRSAHSRRRSRREIAPAEDPRHLSGIFHSLSPLRLYLASLILFAAPTLALFSKGGGVPKGHPRREPGEADGRRLLHLRKPLGSRRSDMVFSTDESFTEETQRTSVQIRWLCAGVQVRDGIHLMTP
ncbi:hypothetical protein Nepgr_024505 [Nepenthes gracilis]|uniref:Uncharacterized protein n=1 Tax=Nepenthes gracilis TaxID=150966 RepID=A0AAD3XYN7_NEPGR|nr:hypothetical protein Nepgr_024505 [Nepenthes gracilis]